MRRHPSWKRTGRIAAALSVVALLALANRREVRVPTAALAGSRHISPAQLRAVLEQGVTGCQLDDPYDGWVITYLSMPVFSPDNQWAMISAASDSCPSEGGERTRLTFHREQGRWALERVERALRGIRQGRALLLARR